MVKTSFFFSFLIFLFFQGCSPVYNTVNRPKVSGQEKLSISYSDIDTSVQFHEAERAAEDTFADLSHYKEDHFQKPGMTTATSRFDNIINQYKRSKE